MDNRTLVERLYHLQEAARPINSTLAGQITRAMIPLLEYKHSLERAKERELLKIPGITESNVAYFMRVFKGEDVEAVAKDMPKKTSERRPATGIAGSRNPKETGNWDGGWDNAVSAYER